MKGRIWKSLIGVSAVAVLAVVGVTSYTVVHYLRTTPRFDVKKVSVVGIKRVEETQVYAQAGLRGSGNIFSVDLDAIRERVEGLRGFALPRSSECFPTRFQSRWSSVSPSVWRESVARFISLMRRPSCSIRIPRAGINFPISGRA